MNIFSKNQRRFQLRLNRAFFSEIAQGASAKTVCKIRRARGDTGQAAEKCSSPILPVRSGIESGGEQGGRWRFFPCRFYRGCRQYRGAPRDSRAQTAPENTRR